jgi:beta-lactam-binding protein with PASTA domain
MERFTIWNDVEGEEQFVKRAFGGTVAAPVWKEFMEYATSDLPVLDFPPEPPGADVYRVVPRTVVPDLAGLNGEEMANAVYGAGLRLDRIEVRSSLPEGSLIRITPRAGTALRQGSTVNVLVSNGAPVPIAGPDLVGKPVGDVTSILEDYFNRTGIRIGWDVEYRAVEDAGLWGIVIATDPAPRTPMEDGDTIRVFVGEQPGG